MPVAVVLNKADLVTREHCQQTVQEVCDAKEAQCTGACRQSSQPVLDSACLKQHAKPSQSMKRVSLVPLESKGVLAHAD